MSEPTDTELLDFLESLGVSGWQVETFREPVAVVVPDAPPTRVDTVRITGWRTLRHPKTLREAIREAMKR
jgi:hypothetical protein